jgi:DNA-binding MarR family transcriptional regulator
MRMPVEAVMQRILAEAHAAGYDDLVPAHFSVLRYPGPDGRRPSDLAAEVGMTKQAMNYLLGQLEQLGYLVREDDPDDRRSKRIQLTERGRGLRRTIRATVDGIERDLEQELGAAPYAQLRKLLVRLNASTTLAGPEEEA